MAVSAGPRHSTDPTRWAAIVAALAIAALSFAVFARALGNEFVAWDDDHLLQSNADYRGFGWAHLHWMFTTFHMGHYQPLTWLSYALDHALWGDAARGYHLANVLLHALNAALVFVLARKVFALTGGDAQTSVSTAGARSEQPGAVSLVAAALAALFFALHPLRVESVAWATERRDVLSAAFFLLTILAYLRVPRSVVGNDQREPRSARRYLLWLAGVLALAVLTTLAKAIGAVLPLILLILDVYPLRRLGSQAGGWTRRARWIWFEKLPFVALGLVAGRVALAAQHSAGAMPDLAALGAGQRLILAVRSVAFYPWKTLVPCRLAPLYEYPYTGLACDGTFWLSLTTAVGATAVAWRLRRRRPGLLAAWAVYLVYILPVSGLFLSGSQMTADRYSYLACLPFALLLGSLLRAPPSVDCERSTRARSFRGTVVALGSVALLALAILTERQLAVWQNTATLWDAVLARYPDTVLAYLHRAELSIRASDLPRAEADLRTALRICPVDGGALATLCYVRALRGDLAEADDLGRRAIAAAPTLPAAYKWHGFALYRLGRLPEARAAHERAVGLAPRDWEARLRLASLLQSNGQLREAIAQAHQAASDAPPAGALQAWELLAFLCASAGARDEALLAVRQILALDPQNNTARQLRAELERPNVAP